MAAEGIRLFEACADPKRFGVEVPVLEDDPPPNVKAELCGFAGVPNIFDELPKTTGLSVFVLFVVDEPKLKTGLGSATAGTAVPKSGTGVKLTGGLLNENPPTEFVAAGTTVVFSEDENEKVLF